MKKLLALMLAAVLALSLVACGGGGGTGDASPASTEPQESDDVLDRNDTSNYIGTWETEHYRLTINRGGVGTYEPIHDNEPYDLDWEVSDEVLVTQISFFGMEHRAVLELSEDADSLSVVQMGFPVYIEGEDIFTKQS